jgi:hypothetical protein
VSGPRGLLVGEPLTGVGDCPVTCVGDWHDCLLTSIKEPSLGHCLPVNIIHQLNTTPKSQRQLQHSAAFQRLGEGGEVGGDRVGRGIHKSLYSYNLQHLFRVGLGLE